MKFRCIRFVVLVKSISLKWADALKLWIIKHQRAPTCSKVLRCCKFFYSCCIFHLLCSTTALLCPAVIAPLQGCDSRGQYRLTKYGHSVGNLVRQPPTQTETCKTQPGNEKLEKRTPDNWDWNPSPLSLCFDIAFQIAQGGWMCTLIPPWLKHVTSILEVALAHESWGTNPHSNMSELPWYLCLIFNNRLQS